MTVVEETIEAIETETEEVEEEVVDDQETNEEEKRKVRFKKLSKQFNDLKKKT
jgi:hypothetical protein